MNQENIGKFIAELRKEKGYTQERLAEILNVSSKSISRWENGKTMPDLSLLTYIADVLDVEVSELLNGRRMTKEELIELKGTIEHLIEYSQNEMSDKTKVWQRQLIIGIGIIVLAMSNNHFHFLEIIFTPNIASFIQGSLSGIGIAYELICVYNVTHELTLKEKKDRLIEEYRKSKNNKEGL